MIYATLASVSVVVLSCAEVVPPAGGPEDKTAPAVLSTQPRSFQTSMPEGNTFTAIFSKPVRELGIANQIFVSPRPSVEPEIKVKGEKLIVEFADEFAEDQTYVVTLGSGIIDLRGNKLGESKSIAFTRGKQIDSSYVSGVVTRDDSPVANTSVALYRAFTPSALGDMDSLYPTYMTMSGDEGEFELGFISSGKYFLLGFEDKNKDKKFQYGVESFGAPPTQVNINLQSYDNLELRLQDVDSSLPEIRSATTTADGFVKLALTGPIDFRTVSNSLDRIVFSAEESGLKYSPSEIKETDLGSNAGPTRNLELYFDSLPSGKYNISADFAAMFSDGRVGDSRLYPGFKYEKPDTKGNLSIVDFSPERPFVFWEKAEARLRLSTGTTLGALRTSISARYENDIELEFELKKISSLEWIVVFNSMPAGGEFFDIIVDTNFINLSNSVDSHDDNRLGLSVWSEDSLGSVALRVENRFDSAYVGSYMYTFDRLEGGSYEYSDSGSDSLGLVLPQGTYRIEALMNSDTAGGSENRFDGAIYPLRYAERRAFFPDTVVVRPRFETGGITIIID